VETLDCYLSTIQVVAECLHTICPEVAQPHAEQLMRLRKRLAFGPTTQAVEESRHVFENELRTFASKVQQYRVVREDDLKDVLLMLAQASDAFAIRNNGYVDQVRHFSRLLTQAEKWDQPHAARERLRQQLHALRLFLDAANHENNRTIDKMGEQMQALRTRSDDRAIDPHTGLATRFELMRQLETRLASGHLFCVILFEMNPATVLSAAALAEVLKQASETLACQVRAKDFVCRYGETQFMVVLECSPDNALPRAQQMQQWLTGYYRIGLDEELQLSFRFKITEHAKNETVTALLDKVDAAEPISL
jgi:GGDEF domain-containing protein